MFSGAVAHAENAADGGLVTLVDHKDRFLARGYWNSQSQIQARIMSWRDEPIDEGWWRKTLARAIDSRAGLDAVGDAYRLVNAENDFIPGLIVDRYADWVVLQALTCHVDQQKERIAELLRELTGVENVYERSDVEARAKEGLAPAVGTLLGRSPADLVDISEGARFQVDIEQRA